MFTKGGEKLSEEGNSYPKVEAVQSRKKLGWKCYSNTLRLQGAG